MSSTPLTLSSQSAANASAVSPWLLCVAPMIDVTDRHCRYFHRLLAPQARLYTEMITTGALTHGAVDRHLDYSEQEHPVALQLGGSEPAILAQCAKLVEKWGYDEVNLNCGCPSERVQKGAFGACLMNEPALVADCIKAMQDAQSLPVTVKHRLGLDNEQSYDYVRDFVGALYEIGCRVFVVHARNAVLKGLSPKDNREVPPLRYDDAARLKNDFPEATIVLNGGLTTQAQCDEARLRFDGVMLGRAAWHDPEVLSRLSQAWWNTRPMAESSLIENLMAYTEQQMLLGVPLRVMVRPLLGLFAGRQGARQWRRLLSDSQFLKDAKPELLEQAWRCLL